MVLTALHCGAESGDLEYLTELLKTLTELSENTSLNVNKENKNTKRTALHMAASGGHLDIVELLHQQSVIRARWRVGPSLRCCLGVSRLRSQFKAQCTLMVKVAFRASAYHQLWHCRSM